MEDSLHVLPAEGDRPQSPVPTEHERSGAFQADRILPRVAWLQDGTAFLFENKDTIRHFDHFYFCFHASILAALSWELGETHFSLPFLLFFYLSNLAPLLVD